MRAAFGFGFGLPLGGGEDSPAVDWNFAVGALPSALTFSRASLATMYDAAGALVWCPHNLLTYSQQFDNAAWAKTLTTVTADAVVAPDGTTTADALSEGASTGAHYVSVSTAPVAGNTYTASVYAKAGTVSVLQILYDGITGSADYCNFDLANGVLGSGTGGQIVSVGDGWYRCSVSGASDGASNGLFLAVVNSTSAGRLASHTGTSRELYVWGAQLNISTLQPYYPTTSAAYYGPRLTYDPVTHAALGLLVEEQRTNLLLNSLLDGTNLSTQSVTVAATQYTLSFYGTGQIVLSGSATATVVGTGAYPTRKTYTFTPSAGSLTLTVTGTVQFANLEAGAFETSFIPTGAASATRADDVVTCTGSAFSSWFNASEGTFVSDSATPIGSGYAMVVGVAGSGDYSGNNAIELCDTGGGTAARWNISVGGANRVNIAPGTGTTPNVSMRLAGAYSVATSNLAKNGVLASSDVGPIAGLPSPLAAAYIGQRNGTLAINGTIARIRYWRKRLTNAQLQALTA